MYLVIDHNKSKHSDKYRLFEDTESALKAFDALGYSKYAMGMKVNLTPGMMNLVDAGEDCNIGFINLEVNK